MGSWWCGFDDPMLLTHIKRLYYCSWRSYALMHMIWIVFYCCDYIEHMLMLIDAMYSSYSMFWAYIDERTIVCGCKKNTLSLFHLLDTFLMEWPMVSSMSCHLLCMGQRSPSHVLLCISSMSPHFIGLWCKLQSIESWLVIGVEELYVSPMYLSQLSTYYMKHCMYCSVFYIMSKFMLEPWFRRGSLLHLVRRFIVENIMLITVPLHA